MSTLPLHTPRLPFSDVGDLCDALARHLLAYLSVEDCAHGTDRTLTYSDRPFGPSGEPTDGELLQHLAFAIYSPTMGVEGLGHRARSGSAQGLRVRSGIILSMAYRIRPDAQLSDYRQAQRLLCRIPGVLLAVDTWAGGTAEIPTDSLRLRLDLAPGLDEYLLLSVDFDVYHQIEV